MRLFTWPTLAQVEAGQGRVLVSFPIYRFDGKRHLEILGRRVW